jgi:hypothetical protein
MRPRLLADVRFAKSPDGVYVEGDQGACTITGGHSHEWLSALAPYLTGEHTLAELTVELSSERKAMVEQIIGALAEQRFVADAADERPHGLSAGELSVYGPEIAWIGYAHDSAGHRFELLRRARVALVVTGEAGPVAAAVLQAGLGSGWKDVRVSGEPVAGLSAAIEAGRRDAAQCVREREGVPDDADVILHVHQGEDPASLIVAPGLVVAGERSGRGGVGQVWVRGDEAWIAPVSDQAAASCWRRVACWPPAAEEPSADCLTGPVPAVVAAQVVLSCFEYLTGMAGPVEDPVLTRIDLRTMDTRRHRVRPLRLDVSDTGGVGDTAGEVPPAALTVEDLLGHAASYVDPRTGVLGGLGEGALAQVPLRVCGATVSDPEGRLPSWAPRPRVYGWGPDQQTAGVRALLAALATYQSLLEDERPSVPYVAPVGVAAGLSWPQAVAGGLAQHCERLLRGHDPGGFPAVPLVDDPQVTRLAGLLTATGEHVIVRDLTAVLGIPAYAAGDGAAACGPTAAAAMRRALERMLLAWQARTEGQPDYADPIPRWADDLCGDGPDAEAAVGAFTRALAGAGREPVVSALGRDAEVAGLLPFVARVTCDD